MSGTRDAIEESELHARIDGRLAPERVAAVDAWLDAHPEDRARLADYAEQRRVLRAVFADRDAGPIPGRLRVARLVAEQRRQRQRRWTRFAAAVVLLVVGGIAGWTLEGVSPALHWPLWGAPGSTVAGRITRDAISAYRTYSVEVRHPVEVGAAQEVHLVQWLSKRLGRPLVVPDLSAAGFALMGGRLLPAEAGPAAQFMYQNTKGERLTLYLRSGVGGETAFRYSEDNGIGAFYWSDQGFGYALAAKLDRKALLQVAEIVYRQTSGDSGKAKIPPAPGKPS
jgi:anti-sigma factor RsiW